MKSIRLGLYVAFATSILSSFGCGAIAPEETVSEEHAALDVRTWKDLINIGPTGFYALKADIDAAGKTWTPRAFSGTFEGNTFVIRNLAIDGGGFFSTLTNATIRGLKLVDVTITGGQTAGIGAVATSATDSKIEDTAVHVNINASSNSTGGLLGTMTGGSILRSYAKGSITGSSFFAGGLVGSAYRSSAGRATISQSYAQMTVNPQTPSTWTIVSGGVVGYAFEADIHDVYAVGDVIGRGHVGGIVGQVVCASGARDQFGLFKTIYRGDVIDRNWSSNDGWSGGVGTFPDCAFRMEQNLFDTSLDQSKHHGDHHSIEGYPSTDLRSPTTVTGGVYCLRFDNEPERCGDLSFMPDVWTAGTSTQHHTLLNMPTTNTQPTR